MEISNLRGFSTIHFPEVDNNRREVKHGFDFGLLGLGYFAIHRILSKKARELQFSFSLKNGIKFSCKFYKE